MKRHAFMGYARKEIAPGEAYESSLGGMTWPGVMRRVIVPREISAAFPEISIEVKGRPTERLCDIPQRAEDLVNELGVPVVDGPVRYDLSEVPYADLFFEPGDEVSIRAVNRNKEPRTFQAGLMIEVVADDTCPKREELPRLMGLHESGPTSVAPGARASLVVAPTDNKVPFKIDCFHLVAPDGVSVQQLWVGKNGLLVPELGAPAAMFQGASACFLNFPIVLPGELLQMEVTNTTTEPVEVNLKIEGSSFEPAPLLPAAEREKLMRRVGYGKFAQVEPEESEDE